MKVKTIATLLFALTVAFGGFLLAAYAEADDAPGGVLIGGVMIIGAVALGANEVLRVLRRQT